MIKTNGNIITIQLPEGHDAGSIDQEQLMKIIQAELDRQERVARESKCEVCKGSGKVVNHYHEVYDSDENGKILLGSSGWGMRYCDCEAGCRVKMEETPRLNVRESAEQMMAEGHGGDYINKFL
jgi:hypothetical protein